MIWFVASKMTAVEGRSRVNGQTTQVDDLQLVALPNAVSCAEMFVRFSVTEWHLRPLADQAVNVVADMVAVAVREADQDKPGMMTVRIRLDGELLVIEVEDGQQAKPHLGVPVPQGLRGGVSPRRGGGRVMWCAIQLPSGMSASAVPLPKRTRRPSPAAQREAEAGEPMGVDPEIIERVMSALSRPSDRRD